MLNRWNFLKTGFYEGINIVLADEISRSSPRTQSALLEAMGEGQVTSGRRRSSAAKPFFVIATRNLAETHGTFPLPLGWGGTPPQTHRPGKASEPALSLPKW